MHTDVVAEGEPREPQQELGQAAQHELERLGLVEQQELAPERGLEVVLAEGLPRKLELGLGQVLLRVHVRHSVVQ